MSMGRPYFKLSITNLVLVNEVYPFDFFLRIRAANSQQYQDSPIILAHQGECQQLFPWQFAVTKTNIKVQFVEISTNTRVEIQRGLFNIQGLTDEDGETVAMIAHRTAKKLCLVTYILQNYQPPQVEQEKQSIRQSSNLQNRVQYSPKSQQKKQKYNRPIISKTEREILSQQIAQINKSIDKILTHEKNQNAVFNKYLNESSSFIREMMNNSKSNTNSRMKEIDDSEMDQNLSPQISILKEISQNQQNQKDELSSKNWYKQKYNKDIPQILSNKDYRKQNASQKPTSEPCISYEKQESAGQSRVSQNQQSLILNEIWFNTETKPREVSFASHPHQKLLLKMKNENEGIYYWKNPIEVPNVAALIVTATGVTGTQLQGCISKKQLQKGKAFLFDEKGEQKGFMKFKQKVLRVYCVQTHQILDVEAKDSQKEEKPQENDDFEVYKVQKKSRSSKRGSRLQTTQEQQRQAPKKEQPKYPPSNRYDLASNSINLPFMRKEVGEKEQNHRASFLSDSHSITSSQFLSRVKLVNLKIDSISVKLQKNPDEFVGKLIKLSTRNKQPFITETINLSHNLAWKGKGYVFQNISPFSELKVELCNDQNNAQTVVGTAKVCLALLDMQKQNSIQFYHEYLRDQNENQIGELIMGYQSMGRGNKGKISSVNRYRDDGLSEQDQLNAQIRGPISTGKRRKVKGKSHQKVREKAKSNFYQPRTKGGENKKNNIGVNGSQAKSLVGGTSAIRAKKYTGGNIIIGRAARFRWDPNSNRLGPGEYQVPSTFERHVEPA